MNLTHYVHTLKHHVLLAILLTGLTHASAQDRNKEFTFQYDAQEIVNGSQYQKIQILDSRKDTTHYGIIQKGFLGKSATVVANPALEDQLQKYLETISNGNTQRDTLLLQIRRLSFSEIGGGIKEKGFFDFRANLYQKKGNNYFPLNHIDSSFQVSGIDVSNKLLKKGSLIVDSFIRKNLIVKDISSESLTLQDIQNIDYKEKEKLPLYAAEHLVDGIYMSYETLKNQKPDYPLVDEKDKKGKIKYYYYTNDKGKKVKLKDSQIYAVVDNDETYVSTSFGYYPLVMENDEYYFYGLAEENSTSFSISAGIGSGFGYGGGMIGIGVGSAPSNIKRYKIKIDHLDGNFEKIERLPN
ncbi:MULTISPECIES: hypothetical protein [Sphingobacterium]|uniref:hypothetical protein n=2 Tax=Sphingobacteriaceae TaxID=84566 RepID=UPI0010519C4F|nr:MULTISPECIES: hypothetical protein [unclassified Sphingobacterium]MCS3555238.1 hypothetical protein [Sphingobacterium sp. JUb21]TCR03615.1 hypothetical protein EDF66_108130 [Sphingobacterium sp. JUb20]